MDQHNLSDIEKIKTLKVIKESTSEKDYHKIKKQANFAKNFGLPLIVALRISKFSKHALWVEKKIIHLITFGDAKNHKNKWEKNFALNEKAADSE